MDAMSVGAKAVRMVAWSVAHSVVHWVALMVAKRGKIKWPIKRVIMSQD